MSRRTVVAVCLAFGLSSLPGVALADPLWTVPPDVPTWGAADRGDVCEHRGDPPCHTTTAPPVTTTSLSGTSSTKATSTTGVSGTWGTSVTTTPTTSTTSTTGVEGTTSTVPITTTTPAGAPSAPSVSSVSNARNVNGPLAATGVMPLWTGLGGLVVLLAGAVLLVFARRRRA
jgi:LPXTG-motif cell wall-anchored protein